MGVLGPQTARERSGEWGGSGQDWAVGRGRIAQQICPSSVSAGYGRGEIGEWNDLSTLGREGQLKDRRADYREILFSRQVYMAHVG